MTARCHVRIALGALVLALLVPAAPAPAADPAHLSDPVDQWLPSSDGATWTYRWSDSAYAPTPTLERYTVTSRTGTSFRLNWTTDDLGNGQGTVQGAGIMEFNRTDAGLINTGWNSTPPPSQFPILCATASGCGNSMAGSLFQVIWGTRGPVIQEPLFRDSSWSATGGADNDVSSENRYLGTEEIRVAAFPAGVVAAKVRSDVTQAGAIGDPYGSGVRMVWWVRGVGPVRVVFSHTGGDTTEAELVGTNLVARPNPSDVGYLPFNRGGKAVYRWRNSKYMPKYSVQKLTVSNVVNNTARVDVKSLSGPIKVAGAYAFATRLSGTTSLAASTKAASLANFPPLGPRSVPKSRRRHFFTPLDFMAYGYQPVLPAYPKVGDYWKSDDSGRDFAVFGVHGYSRVLGFKTVKTPAGRFRALEVQSKLRQSGFPFGSGVRTSYFAAGRGLVKLVFEHGDGSTSTVDLVR